MHELDCDFCDAPAVGAYEVGPEPPERSPTDRRRLVLCADCRETLAVAIEPLLDRLDAAEANTGGDTGDGSDERPADRAGGDRVSRGRSDGETSEGQTSEAGRTRDDDTGITVDVGADDQTRTRDGSDTTATREESDDVATRDESDTTATGDESDDTATDDPLATDATTTDGAATGDATDGTASATATADGETVESAAGTDDRSTGSADDHSTADGASETGDDETTIDATGDEQVGEEPPQFRRVMRLLNNREFPVDRGEFADLATGAYGLEEHEVDRIVEYAVDRGVLALEDGQLVKG